MAHRSRYTTEYGAFEAFIVTVQSEVESIWVVTAQVNSFGVERQMEGHSQGMVIIS